MDVRSQRRRTYLRGIAATVAGGVGLAGCSGTDTGTLATRVTDQPGDIEDFESCVVTIAGVWLGPSGETTGTADGDGRRYLAFESPAEADLVELSDGSSKLVDEQAVETGQYAFLQLDVTDVSATLSGGESAQVTVPGSAPLTFNKRFEIRSGSRTIFTADFTPVKQGQTGRYVLQPVPQGITVEYES